MSTDLKTDQYSVLHPVAVEDFFSVYWEKRPLHIARGSTDVFTHLISSSSLEQLLCTQDLQFPTVQLTKSKEGIAVSEYSDDSQRILPSRLFEQYNNGATIVFSHAQKYVSELANLCRRTQQDLQMLSQTNVYLSPPGHQGFNAHYDSHDVFILQIAGKKTFKFYSGGVAFPTHLEKFDASVTQAGRLTETVELSPGDTLYIPRGIIHDAIADSAESSLHVTLGVYPILVRSLAEEVLNVAASSITELRKSIPRYEQQQSVTYSGMDSKQSLDLIDTIKSAFTRENIQEALSRLNDNMALETLPISQNQLSKKAVYVAHIDDVLSVQSSAVINLEVIGRELRVRVFGQIVEFSEPFANAVEQVLGMEKLIVSEVNLPTDEQKLALCSQLVGLGVLSPVT